MSYVIDDYPYPPVPPRSLNCGSYENGRSVWEVEKECNTTAGGFRRFWLRFRYSGIYVWKEGDLL